MPNEKSLPDDSWILYQKLVLSQLKDLSDGQVEIKKHIGDIEKRQAVLETKFELKSGIWGFAAGSLPAIFYLIYESVKKLIKP